jgi:hypothetical protein
VHASRLHATVGLAVALVLLTLVMGRYINVNTFSLHGMYRNRLVRAYLAASRPGAGGGASFTGFDDAMMRPLREKKRRCAVAAIRYSAVDDTAADGRLVYIKPLLLGDEAPDVMSYASQSPAFPHEGTENQWFTEAQTESYRALGESTIEELCRGWRGGSLDDFATHVAASYLGQGVERQPRAV